MNVRSTDLADKSAILLSGLCVLHCLLPLLLAVILPYFVGMSIFTNESLHLWAIIIILPMSVYAIGWGYYQHRNRGVMLFAFVGFMMLIGSAIFGHDLLGHKGEIAMTVCGSLLMVFGHLKNARLRKAKDNKNLSLKIC